MTMTMRKKLSVLGLLGLLTGLWSCSTMNSDITAPVKAQSTQNLLSANTTYKPGPAAAKARTPLNPLGKQAVLDDNADLEPDMSDMPLTPGQTGTLLEPEVLSPPLAEEPQLTPEQRRILSERSGLDFDIDLFDSKEVERYFAYYTGPARETFARWLKRAEVYLPHVRDSLVKNGLPQDLAMLPFAESGYNCYAYSWAGAGGMWQFMPYTGRKYGLTVDWWIDERRDPRLSTEAAGKYLAFLNDMFGDWYLALAAYNAGEGKISRALAGTDTDDFLDLVNHNNRLSRRARLKPETQNYVPKFIAITKIFQNLEALGFEPVRWDAAPKIETVNVPGGTDLLALAKSGGMNWDEFHQMNPSFRRQVSPPDRSVSVAIPVSRRASMLAYLENPGARPYEGIITHQVAKGESLRTVAQRYRVPQEVICQINGQEAQSLRPGQCLLIPASGTGEAMPGNLRKTRRIASSRANYVVRGSDNVWSISKKFNVSVKTLLAANGLSNSKGIKPGLRLSIPDASSKAARKTRAQAAKAREQATRYTVRRGDTLMSLSRRFGVSAEALKDWNNIKGSDLRTGANLKVYLR
ncbi:MAG: LysM peptidoglycan-binding domain-containing protein [Proteobacteria bacterium]|nr:LysM peptidoglycan-binding domain-containing protein [Pseudomonadota bacterium]MBU1595911.1 LysM peptidoglycan-binding domain-containing protein [Pseudomonadota bacterium]